MKYTLRTFVLVFTLSLTLYPFSQIKAAAEDSANADTSTSVTAPSSADTSASHTPGLQDATVSPNPESVDTLTESAPSGSTSPNLSSPSEATSTPASQKKNPTQTTNTAALAPVGTSNPLAPFNSPTATNSQSRVPQPDSSTGAATIEYPITVPPGRNGMQPNLTLSYNSQNIAQNSIFGLGWSLNIPSISRINRTGTDQLFSSNYFTSSLSGDLVNTSGANYVSRADSGDFLKYVFSSNTWTVTDKSGTVYTFGAQASTRQDNPSNTAQIYKWMLEKEQDTNGNNITYSYFKDSGQIYPDTITYTNNSGSTGIFSVTFTRQSRQDTIADGSVGFLVTTNYRISQIQTSISSTWARRYALGYTVDSPSNQSLLASITESAQDGAIVTNLPAETFNYQDISNGGWTYNNTWSNPADQYAIDYATATSTTAPTVSGHPEKISFDTHKTNSDGSITAILTDVNGDGLPDALQSGRDLLHNIDNTYLYQNNGQGWTYNSSWTAPTDQYLIDYATATSTAAPTVNGHAVRISFNTHKTNADGSAAASLIDLNGDGLPDAIESFRNTSAGLDKTYVYQNTGSGWALNTSWSTPTDQREVDYASATSTTPPTVSGHPERLSFDTPKTLDGSIPAFLADINSDGLPDAIQSFRDLAHNLDGTYIYMNTGSGWTYAPTWSTPADQYLIDYAAATSTAAPTVNGHPEKISFDTHKTNSDGSVTAMLTDVNGDGLLDAVQSFRNTSTGMDNSYIYLNTGAGWIYSAQWSTPADDYAIDYALASGSSAPIVSGHPERISYNTHKTNNDGSIGGQTLDLNGDGLADGVQSQRCMPGSCLPASATYGLDETYIYSSSGTGWGVDTAWNTPTDQREIDYANATGGTPPVVNGHPEKISLSTSKATDGSIPAVLADLNGDGLADAVQSFRDLSHNLDNTYVYLNTGSHPLLSSVTLPQGGSYSMGYKPTAQFVDGSGTLLNPNLPYIVQALSSVTQNDGLGNTAATTYSYSGGKYFYNASDLTQRKFAGFNTITKTDPAGNITKIFYHQGNGTDTSHGEFSDDYFKIGKIYRVEQYDNAGHLFAKTINKWSDSSIASGAMFVKLDQTVSSEFDSGSTHKDSATAYTYNSTTGNPSQKTEYGEVTGSDDGSFTDTGSDLFTTTYAYASGGSVIGLPDDVTVTNQSSVKVKETKYFFDSSLTLGTVTNGNLTEADDWKSGTNYITHKKTYDGTYGLVTQELDPNNNPTNYSFDTFNLYPITITNALSQIAHYTYDYPSGKVAQTTDLNGFVFKNTYDGLGRVTLVQQPDLTTPATLITKTVYTYTDTQNAVSVAQSDYMDASNTVSSYTYFDGLGRAIQQRKSAEDSGNFNVKDSAYNNLGLLAKESLPYASSGSAKTSPTTTTTLYINYSYDPLSRITTVSNAVGTTSNSYTPWQVSVTDPNSHTKDLIKDAYGNLAQVNEHNGASTYVTTYAFDYLKDLTSITDASNNVRNFTYDGLGRRLSAQDLHPASSSTFGAWTYAYDNAGNLTQTIDPNGNTINYTYDVLNRPALEKLAAVTKVTYGYDTCGGGIGKLCSVTTPALTTNETYNALGLIASEIKNISATNYETDYTYDRQGNQLTIVNPDGSQVIYTYNLAGLPETVSRKETTDTSAKAVVSNFDYSPLGAPSSITFANGAATTNTYDSTKIYRLTRKVTALSASNLQDISYTYDPVGNISAITDNSATNTKKNITYGYDALNRLTSYTVTGALNANNHSETYSYDALGNITNKSDLGNYTYGGTGLPNPDAVTAIGSTAYTYDNNGNLRTAGSNLTNTWDYNNRLTQSVVGTTTITYAYDQSGERIKYSNGTTTTIYPTKNYNTNGTTPTKHIFANGQLIADITGTGVGASAAYVNSDHLTGSNVVTNDAGATKEVLDYYPFGASRLDEQTGFNEQRKYAGHEFDADTGLSYQDARYYNSSIGRFTGEDASFLALGFNISDPQSMNAYSYARNNPLLNIDPDGRMFLNVLGFLPNSVQIAIGNWANNTYANNSVARFALDHPYIPAIVGGAPLAVYGAVVTAPSVAAATSDLLSSPAAAPLIRSGAIGAGGGIIGQGASDVLNSIAHGKVTVSSPQQYANSAAEGFAGGLTKGFGFGNIATGITVGTAHYGLDSVEGNNPSILGSAGEGLTAAVGGKIVDSASGIAGRLPNPGTANYYLGSHAQQLGIGEVVGGLISGIKNLFSKK
jgi:RHS repeat-associated protein